MLVGLLALLLTACGTQEQPRTPADPTPEATQSAAVDALSVAEAVERAGADAARFAGQSVDVVGYVNNPPGSASPVSAPQSGCPVVLDRLPSLTDEPFARTFSVAGVTLPNPVPAGVPSLKLVIPYSLGIIEVPPHAQLRGHFGDPAYAQCPEGDTFFVLDSVVAALPGEQAVASPQIATDGWVEWQEPGLGIRLRYPGDWRVEEARNTGAIVAATFSAPDQRRVIRLAVLAGETLASPAAGGPLPAPLAGDRQLPASLGPARARLVDVTGKETTAGHEREIRLVLNYGGNTVVLSTRFTDGLALDRELLDIFTAVAASVQFENPVELSDPLDPTLSARRELGAGPFIGEATARQRALAVSGVLSGEALDARLVSEWEARQASPGGSCREFLGQPEGVWLVIVEGTLPTGQEARRLVYLDAVTGEGLCQTEAPPPTP